MGSRAIALNFSGMPCPVSFEYGFSHGTNPAVGYVRFDGSVIPPFGIPLYLQVGNSLFVGYVDKYEIKEDLAGGLSTSVRSVDWRDRLHDKNYFAAWNMQEDNGTFWHLKPENWELNRRTVMQRLPWKQDFDQVQALELNDLVDAWFGVNLVSSATLLNGFAADHDFEWIADEQTREILEKTYPMNMDFTGGVKIIDAIQQILDQSRMQFSCFGERTMVISIQGIGDSQFINAYLDGMASICQIGATSGGRGREVSTKGRRAIIVGSRNREQFTFPCVPSWNQKFNFEMCFGSFSLANLLKNKAVTLSDKLWQLGDEYFDLTPWRDLAGGNVGAEETRSFMTIEEYVSDVCFRTYMVDFTNCAQNVFLFTEEPEEQDINGLETVNGHIEIENFSLPFSAIKNNEWGFAWKEVVGFATEHAIANHLNTDTDLQFVAYGTVHDFIQGSFRPNEGQRAFAPMKDGVSMEVREVYDFVNQRMKNAVFLKFSKPQYWIEDVEAFRRQELTTIQPAYVLCTLALETKRYRFSHGDDNGFKLRENVKSVSSLYRAWVDGEEVHILSKILKQPVQDGQLIEVGAAVAKADDIALQIAKLIVFQDLVTNSGHLVFENTAGTYPNGYISAVAVSMQQGELIREDVRFSDLAKDDENFVLPRIIRQGQFFRFSEDVKLDALRLIGRNQIKLQNTAAKLQSILEKAIETAGGFVEDRLGWTAFGREGTVKVKLDDPGTTYSSFDVDAGDVMVLGDDTP